MEYHKQSLKNPLRLILRGAIAAGDVGLVSGLFDSVRNGFADAFVED